MSRYSAEFVTGLAVIAAKAAIYTQGAWSADECAAFAWFSANQSGDAEVSDEDFSHHMTAYVNTDTFL